MLTSSLIHELMQKKILAQTSSFKKHSLSMQDKAKLMQRVETKFLLATSSLQQYLANLTEKYTLLEVQNKQSLSYETSYFDTPELDHYKAHHNGKLNRHKVRIRRYKDTDCSFLEVKTKTNKNRSIKTRIDFNNSPLQPLKSDSFIQETLGHTFDILRPSLNIHYKRITLMSLDYRERVTIDTNLSFLSARNKNHFHLPNICVIEIKSDKKISDTIAFKKVVLLGERPKKFSKYCIGLALTEKDNLKQNQFKSIINRLDVYQESCEIKSSQTSQYKPTNKREKKYEFSN